MDLEKKNIVEIFQTEINKFFYFLRDKNISLLPDKIIMEGKDITKEELEDMFNEYCVKN